jgi:hypothetical protein
MITIFTETIAKDPEEKTDLESFRKDADSVATTKGRFRGLNYPCHHIKVNT